MVRDPDRYFADARQRATHERASQARWRFPFRPARQGESRFASGKPAS
jgi:hypothetical protein